MSEQLSLFDWVEPPHSVLERCAAKYSDGRHFRCTMIVDENFQPVRFVACQHWCPLLLERIEA